MTEETTNLILEILPQVRGKIDAMSLDIGDLKLRMTAVETTLGQQ